MCRLVPVLVVLAAVSGCGADRKGDVSGQVTFAGSPLPAGKITFICEGGDKPVFTVNIKDGMYEIKGVPVGQVKITIATFKPSSQKVDRPAGLGPTTRPESEDAAPREKEKYVEIPPRYGHVEGSNLSYEVKPGSQEYDIPLTP